MRARSVAWLLAVGVSIAACGTSGSDGSSRPADVPADVDVDAGVAARPTIPPALARGESITGTIEIDGTVIEYVAVVPGDFEVGATAPVLLALPPGGQTLALARGLVDTTYAAEATRLGWVVVSPAAPGDVLFFQGSEALLPRFLDWVETWVTPEGGAAHVAGVSNGGISSFRFAAENPERVASVVAFPGFARSAADQQALASLGDVPVRMFVGEADTSWVETAEETLQLAQTAGIDAELVVYPGEGHIMTSTVDGTVVFAALESFRDRGGSDG